MFWSPKSLLVQVYENDKLLDLNTLSDDTLGNIADAVFELWKTPSNSAVSFRVEIFEYHYFCKHQETTIEVRAYDREDCSIAISKIYYAEKKIGKKFKIKPKDNLFHKFNGNVEVAFVV